MADEIPLLATKLFLPPRAIGVLRPRLTERLNDGLIRPLTLVSAPAGSGKTTLLSEWRASKQSREVELAWLSLDPDENEPTRFLTYLIAAVARVRPGFGESALALLREPQAVPVPTIMAHLIRDGCALQAPLVLALDDFHRITAPAIQDALAFLLDHWPPPLHLVILTRADPPLPLARLRAHDQLTEIRAADLRFTTDETETFLNHGMGLHVSSANSATLAARTEGWIAGLQLAALALQGRPDSAAFIKAFSGSHVYVADYLVEEVLKRQPEATQAFLMQTSILERLSAGLCQAVTGCPDGQALLTALHRANVFVIPLDDEGQWFRYHHLFADLLRSHLATSLPSAGIAALHTRAAAWFEHQGLMTEAVRHALAANDLEYVAALVDQAAPALLVTGQYSVLRGWLAALPESSFQAHPRLAIDRVLIDLSQATLEMSTASLLEKETSIRALPPSPENDRLRLEALVHLSLFWAHENPSRAIQIAQETLAQLPEDALGLRAALFSALYRAHGMEGDLEKSEPAYQECLRLAQAAGQYGMVANTTMVRAFDLGQYGRLHEAARYCQSIIDRSINDRAIDGRGAELGQAVFYQAGPCWIGLAGVHLERNDLEAAEACLDQGMELCRQAGLDGLYTGYTQRARLRQARGDLEGALAELGVIEQTFQRRDFTLLARQVSIRLALGDVAGAATCVEPWLLLLADLPGTPRPPLIAVEATRAVVMGVLLAQGQVERAIRMADELQATAEPGRRFGRVLEAQLLLALAARSETTARVSTEAIGHLERALDLAEPAGMVLRFLEEGPALIPLLEAVAQRRETPVRLKTYARTILDAFELQGHRASPRSPGAAPGLVEPLTAREVEVLHLIATGASNQAIADQLIIAVRTVKKHTGNIFGKLGVSSRTQALARARDFGLL